MLERIPFIQEENFDFWREISKSVNEMLKVDKSFIEDNLTLPKDQKLVQLEA